MPSRSRLLSDTHIDVCKKGHSPEERRSLRDILAQSRQVDRAGVGVLSLDRRVTARISKLVEGVSQRMLTLTLKSLERDGIVTRTVTRPIRHGWITS